MQRVKIHGDKMAQRKSGYRMYIYQYQIEMEIKYYGEITCRNCN